jgi:hypothetical protein
MTEYRTKNKFFEMWKNLAKATNIAFFSLTLINHSYAAILLILSSAIPEIYLTTIIFEFFMCGGGIFLLSIAGRGQRGVVLEWLSFFIINFYNAFILIWQIEQFDLFKIYALNFPLNTLFLYFWIIMLIFSLMYLVLVLFISLSRVLLKRVTINHINRKIVSVKNIILITIPILMMIFALPITDLYVNEGTVKKVISIPDTNTNCTLCVWDLPNANAQIGSSQDIDINSLTDEENRTLYAFGRMNTTFVGLIFFDTESEANFTISRLKTFHYYNLSVYATIWYAGEKFPGPTGAQIWVDNARKTLEFLIDNNIKNVLGICADSESESECTPEEYWEYISLYDDFIKEVQTNVSLRHPDLAKGTFDTVLCFEPRALMDALDGDYDIVFGRENLGLPPSSWTKYHIMSYRTDINDNTAWLHNFNLLALKYFGKDIYTPIVGLAGVYWFDEGYYEGTYNRFDSEKTQLYDYDGIDGWAAMKREIFYCKALGFKTVSVFKLYSYGSDGVVEDYGIWDQYGLEKIEELAAEWNIPKTIDYPISSIQFDLRRAAFFNPNGELIYDLQTNIEMYIVAFVLCVSIIFWIVFRLIILIRIEKTILTKSLNKESR